VLLLNECLLLLLIFVIYSVRKLLDTPSYMLKFVLLDARSALQYKLCNAECSTFKDLKGK